MKIFFSAVPPTFYHSDVPGQVPPPDAIEISADEYATLIKQHSAGMVILADAHGRPVAGPPPPRSEAEVALSARRQRDHLLSESDRRTAPDYPQTDAERAAWLEYRQALRDLTEQAGFPSGIAWPTPPAPSSTSDFSGT